MYSLPGVMKADTVHSLNLSIDFKYLFVAAFAMNCPGQSHVLEAHMLPSFFIASSITSRLAFAII